MDLERACGSLDQKEGTSSLRLAGAAKRQDQPKADCDQDAQEASRCCRRALHTDTGVSGAC